MFVLACNPADVLLLSYCLELILNYVMFSGVASINLLLSNFNSFGGDAGTKAAQLAVICLLLSRLGELTLLI
jgi:hypothetical protein